MAPSTQPTSFNLSRWAINHVQMTWFLCFLVIAAGVFGLSRMGQKEDPDFTFRVMIVRRCGPARR